MQIAEKTRGEIEAKANKMSDFLKMEYLENCVNKLPDIEIKRYCYQELSKLYEKNAMFTEAIRYLEKFQEVSIGQKEKKAAYFRYIELLMKAGQYDRVEFAYQKAFQFLTAQDLVELEDKIKDFYIKEGEKFEKLNKNSSALKVYEKLNKMSPGNVEIKRKLNVLYKKLGMVRESLKIESELQKSF